MLPLKINQSDVACLSSLVAVRADCTTDTALHYIEDVEGCDITTLARIATAQSPSGKSMAEDIISSAAREMMGDIDFAGGGLQLQTTFGDVCSNCDFIPNYTNGGGIKIQKVIGSRYSILRIFQVDVATNFTGDAVLVIDDGKTPRSFNVTLVANQLDTLKVTYQTDQRIVKIYFQGNNIPMAKINCHETRSCGCGGGGGNHSKDSVRYSGLINGNDTEVQYGFKVCASITCENSIMICELIAQAPNAFALTLLYKIGAKYYSEARESTRINRVGGRDGDEKKDMNAFYTKLYNNRMKGSGDSKSIESIVKLYLKERRRDSCVTCESLKKTAWVTG